MLKVEQSAGYSECDSIVLPVEWGIVLNVFKSMPAQQQNVLKWLLDSFSLSLLWPPTVITSVLFHTKTTKWATASLKSHWCFATLLFRWHLPILSGISQLAVGMLLLLFFWHKALTVCQSCSTGRLPQHHLTILTGRSHFSLADTVSNWWLTPSRYYTGGWWW